MTDNLLEQIQKRVGKIQGLMDLAGNSIYFECKGHGKALIFLHDGLLHSKGFESSINFFSEQFTVIFYDRPGYGLSQPPTTSYSHVRMLRHLVEILGIDQVTIIGGSQGASIAIDFALAHPDIVQGLALAGSGLSGFPYSEHFHTRGRKQAYPENTQKWIEFWANDPWFTIPQNTQARGCLRDILAGSPQNLEFFDVPIIDDEMAIGRLAELRAPLINIVGEGDIADIHAISGVIKSTLPNSERTIVSNSGHLVYLEQANVFNNVVYEFLQEKNLL